MSTLSKKEQNELISQIPDNKYTEEEIYKIVDYIRDGTMISIKQLPKPTKKLPKVPLSAVVKDKRKKAVPEPKPEPKPKALKPVIKQGRPRKIKTAEQIKAEEKAIEEKIKAKESKLKPYYKIGTIPKGFRRASMAEAKKAGKVYYWGLKQIDNKILNLTEETDPKAIKAKISEKTIKLAGLMGKFNNLKKNIAIAKNNNDNEAEKKANSELDEVKKNILIYNNELNLLKDKLKKRGSGFSNTSDDDADSDTDNVYD